MVGLHIVLRNFAFIDLVLFRQEVYSKRLLKQRITPVFFVPQYSEFDTKPQGVAFKVTEKVSSEIRTGFFM